MTENTPVNNGIEEGIAEVELLSEQREFDRAASLGQELLRSHPTNPRLHEVMGDVAVARGDGDDAVRWYELSLQLEHNDTVMNKMARQRGLSQWRHSQRAQQPETTTTPEDDGRQHHRLIAGVAAAVVIIILAIFLIVGMGRWVNSPTPNAPSRTSRSAPVRPGNATRPTPPAEAPNSAVRPNLPAPRATPTSPARSSYTRTPQRVAQPDNRNLPPVRVTRDIAAPLSSRDERLVKSLGKLKWPNGKSLSGDVNAMFDPFTGYTFITVQLPRSLNASQEYETVVTVSYEVAQEAIRIDQGVRDMTVRFIAKVAMGEETPTVTIYRGNTTRKMVSLFARSSESKNAQNIREKVFAATWWNPSVKGGKN